MIRWLIDFLIGNFIYTSYILDGKETIRSQYQPLISTKQFSYISTSNLDSTNNSTVI